MADGAEGSAGERAYTEIRRRIVEGEYPPGTMLGENPTAQSLGLSRTPVRAALARLQDDGWISIYPKRGALVRGLDPEAIAELAETLYILESAGIARAEPDDLARLAARLASSVVEQRRTFEADDLDGFIGQTIEFHREFVAVAGNRVLLELCDRMADRQRHLLFIQGDRLRTRCQEILAEHDHLVARLARSDGEGFIHALHDHFADTHGIRIRERGQL